MSSLQPMDLGLTLINHERAPSEQAVQEFLTACDRLSHDFAQLAMDHPGRLINVWLYGRNDNDNLAVETVLVCPSLPAHSEVIKSKSWKTFIRASQHLGIESEGVRVVGDASGNLAV